MAYSFTVEFGKRKFEGSFGIEGFPGNCGYKVLTYIHLNRGDNKHARIGPRHRKYIADNLRYWLHKEFISVKKFVITAKSIRTNGYLFDTIDFIDFNSLQKGSEVKGNYGKYTTVVGEYDCFSPTLRLPNPKPMKFKGATFECNQMNAW